MSFQHFNNQRKRCVQTTAVLTDRCQDSFKKEREMKVPALHAE